MRDDQKLNYLNGKMGTDLFSVSSGRENNAGGFEYQLLKRDFSDPLIPTKVGIQDAARRKDAGSPPSRG
jgi:hypothetical protein